MPSNRRPRQSALADPRNLEEAPWRAASAVELALQTFRGGISTKAGWYLRDSAGAAHAWAPEIFDFYGFAHTENAPSSEEVYARLLPTDRGRVISEVRQAAVERRGFEILYQIQNPGGEKLTLRNCGQTISVRGHEIVIGTVTDISQEQKALAHLLAARAILSPPEKFETQERATRPTDLNLDNLASRRCGLSRFQVERIRKLIHQNLAQGMDVPQMARAAGMSCAHFSRAFKIATGEAPHQFMLNLRLAKAKEALQALPSTSNLSMLSAELGFFDQAHLTKYFRKKYGQTPGQFLRAQRTVVDGLFSRRADFSATSKV